MNVKRLCGLVVVAGMMMCPTAVEAAHRHCRTCPSGSYSRGNWFHFSSGGGMYVPFRRTAEVVGPTTYRRPVYYGPQPAFAPAVRQYGPPCPGCRVR